MSDIIEAQIELRNPEDLGPCELRFGHPHTGLGGGYHKRPGVGESQCGGEVDWKAKVRRLERCLLQLHGPEVARRRGGGIGWRGRADGNGAGAGVWARHGNGSNPWSVKVATMIVAKQNRSIGRGSIPCPP